MRGGQYIMPSLNTGELAMNNLTAGRPVKNLVMFTLPIFAGNILQQLYNVADSIIVGRFAGKDALAAVGTSQPIIMILVAIIMGLNVGTEVMLSQSIGEADYTKAKRIANTMYLSVMAISVVVGVSGALLCRELLVLIRTPAVIIDDAVKYLTIIFLGLPGLAGYNTLNGMIRSSGNTVTPLVFLAIASMLNIGLDIVFVKVFSLGVTGVALATIIAQTVSFLLCLMWLKKIDMYFGLKLNLSKFSKAALGRGVKLGIPAAIQLSAMSSAAFAVQIFINKLATTDIISAYMIGMKVDTFAALPVMSLSLAMVTIIGQNVGAGNRVLLRKYQRYAKISGVAFGLVMTLVMQFCGVFIVRIFIDAAETEVVRYATMYIRSLSVVYVLVTYFEVVFGILRGQGNPRIPMIFSIVGTWFVRVPLAWILINRYGFFGVCLAVPIAWTLIFVLTVSYEGYSKHKLNKLKGIVEID